MISSFDHSSVITFKWKYDVMIHGHNSLIVLWMTATYGSFSPPGEIINITKIIGQDRLTNSRLEGELWLEAGGSK